MEKLERMEAGPSKKKEIMMNETTKFQDKLKARPNKRMKTMNKETTPSFSELEALPVEVLVNIFNYLPNNDVRCGVSLVCKKFLEICKNESLVPVKDLCLFGQPFNQKLFHNFHRISASIHGRICQIYRAAPLEISDNYVL